MPEMLKKLREPAALAAVVFAGLVVLVGIVNLLAPPGNGASAVPFSDRAFNQATAFLSLDVAAAIAFAVYLANHAGPAVPKARLITLAALIEVGLAALFGVISALALFGASSHDGESTFLRFLEAAGGAAVVAVAGLFTWLTWQTLAPATSPAGGSRSGGAFVGGNWPTGPGGAGTGAGGPAGQQYGQPTPPPGGFGWTPQQSAQQTTGQSSPTVFGQQAGQGGQAGQPGQLGQPGQGQMGHVPGQSAGYGGQPSPQGPTGAPQPFSADRTQMLPPVQSGQPGQFGQPPQPGQLGQPGQPGQHGQPDQPGLSLQPGQYGQQHGQPGQPQPGAAPIQSPFGQPPQPGQLGQPGQSGYGQAPQAPQPPQLGQQIGQATVITGGGTGIGSGTGTGSGSHQVQPPLPPTMQGYVAESSPWSPGGPGSGAGGAMAGQQGQPGQQGTGQQQGQPQPGQQSPQTRPEDAEQQRPGPFQIGDWRSE